MIIWVASFPRSGNQFFLRTLRQQFGVDFYTVYESIERFQLPLKKLGLSCFHELAALPEPYFIKTHELPGDDDYPAIYLVRDGRDSIVSYAHYIYTFLHQGANNGSPPDAQTISDTIRDILTLEASFGGWGRNVSAWQRRAPRPQVIRFEDFVARPESVIPEAIEQLGVPGLNRRNDAELTSFADLSQNNPRLYRRGKIGGFRDEMTAELEELFWQKYGPVMQEVGYSR